MNIVALSTDGNPSYSFYAPLTALLWQRRGWSPLVLVGRDGHTSLKIIDDSLRLLGAHVVHLYAHEHAASSTTAQVARLFAASADRVRDNDYLLTSDIDMWPIGSWVGGDRDEHKDLQVYFANANPKPNYTPLRFPLCYVGGSAHTWRDIMKVSDDASVQYGLDRALDDCRLWRPIELSEAEWAWSFDEIYLGRKIAAWSGYPDRCQRIDRDMSVHGQRRLDRSSWNVPASLDGIADAHLPRPGYTDKGWACVRPLFAKLVDARDLAWADSYRMRFTEAAR